MEAYLSKPPMMKKKQRPEVGIYNLFHAKAKIRPARALSPEEPKILDEKDWAVI
jgi:hypothetical protein